LFLARESITNVVIDPRNVYRLGDDDVKEESSEEIHQGSPLAEPSREVSILTPSKGST
jgi:hypothetical protein